MLTASALPLALAATLATSASAHYVPPSGHGHVARSHLSHRSFFPERSALQARKNRHARRGADPASIMPGTLTSAEGCTAFYHVESGDWCTQIVDKTDGLETLADFYEMNPQIDAEDCKNLWAGYDVCVSRAAKAAASTAHKSTPKVAEAAKLTQEASSSSSSVSPSPKVKAVKTTTSSAAPQTTTHAKAAVKVAAVHTTTSSPAPKKTTSSAAPKATSSAAAEEEEDDDDWVCDEDEEDDSSDSSSWSAPASTSAYVASTTTTSAWVAPTTTTTQWKASSSSSAAKAESTKVADTSSASVLAASNIQGFLGSNDNAILSWYNTNSGQDSTNGHSWCGFPYDNNVPGFAPSLSTMMKNFNYDYEKAATAYCGLEAIVTTADGKSMTLYIADAFDDTWVRTPSSLDLIHGAFNELWGSSTDNKNDVFKGASWKLTGARNDKYRFKSTNSLS
ncbi:hypothetical protein JCM10213_009143 [Rhodosporidiobolus nylandii]